jgi:ammonia channel protein AmtB
LIELQKHNLPPQNVIDTAIGSLGWMVCGYALASGDDNWDKEDGGGFVGTGFELEGEEGQHVFATHKMLKKTGAYASWFFGFTFCAT